MTRSQRASLRLLAVIVIVGVGAVIGAVQAGASNEFESAMHQAEAEIAQHWYGRSVLECCNAPDVYEPDGWLCEALQREIGPILAASYHDRTLWCRDDWRDPEVAKVYKLHEAMHRVADRYCPPETRADNRDPWEHAFIWHFTLRWVGADLGWNINRFEHQLLAWQNRVKARGAVGETFDWRTCKVVHA